MFSGEDRSIITDKTLSKTLAQWQAMEVPCSPREGLCWSLLRGDGEWPAWALSRAVIKQSRLREEFLRRTPGNPGCDQWASCKQPSVAGVWGAEGQRHVIGPV